MFLDFGSHFGCPWASFWMPQGFIWRKNMVNFKYFSWFWLVGSFGLLVGVLGYLARLVALIFWLGRLIGLIGWLVGCLVWFGCVACLGWLKSWFFDWMGGWPNDPTTPQPFSQTTQWPNNPTTLQPNKLVNWLVRFCCVAWLVCLKSCSFGWMGGWPDDPSWKSIKSKKDK